MEPCAKSGSCKTVVISSVSPRFFRNGVGESVVFGTVMSARKSALTLPLSLQFLAAWFGSRACAPMLTANQ